MCMSRPPGACMHAWLACCVSAGLSCMHAPPAPSATTGPDHDALPWISCSLQIRSRRMHAGLIVGVACPKVRTCVPRVVFFHVEDMDACIVSMTTRLSFSFSFSFYFILPTGAHPRPRIENRPSNFFFRVLLPSNLAG